MDPERKVRLIDRSGVDENGVRCSWTGFDKTTGEFFGVPVKDNSPESQPPTNNPPRQR